MNGLNNNFKFLKSFRTTTNIALEDGTTFETTTQNNNDEDAILLDMDDSCMVQPNKRRRSSSNSDQMKLFETVVRSIKENQSKKMEIFQKSV